MKTTVLRLALAAGLLGGLVSGAATAQAGAPGMTTKLPRVDAQQTKDQALAPVGYVHDRHGCVRGFRRGL